MSDASRLRGLVDLAYDVTLDRAQWRAFAARIAALFDADSCAVMRASAPGGTRLLSSTENLTPRLIGEYEAHYHKSDEWALRGSKIPSVAALGQDLISDDELHHTECFNDFNRRVGAYQLVGATVRVSAQDIGLIGVHRGNGARTFADEHRRLMADFFPHLTRAMRICALLDTAGPAQWGIESALQAGGGSVIVVDAEGRLIFASASAERHLHGDGLTVENGRLSACNSEISARFARLIKEAAMTGAGHGISAGGTILMPRLAGRPLAVAVSPLREGAIPGVSVPLALIVLRDPDAAQAPASARLGELFGLTAVESQLAAVLTEGRSVRDFAEARSISVHTANTHLKNLMAKTHTSRQAELVALLLRSGFRASSDVHAPRGSRASLDRERNR